ncbi:hypothetical protein HF638_21215 [Paenibacillus sp. SZ31]|uniref:hypothetical protein n=1 Tax=Paenibacillus sp. SZ31 TaxID=2725555 RepID=UPI00146AE834|nr:hypothetical protein [Paenibacillus sp. SZ31]NMI06508.1 hypothetical protein [Paenibacillus sp. SZ31]
MATLFIYKMSDQLDLFLFDENGNLSIPRLTETMEQRISPNHNGLISGEGFTNITTFVYDGVHCLECFCTTESSLGYYYQARVEQGNVTTEKVQHSYFSKSNVKLTSDGNLIIKFDWTSEEKAKSRVKEMIQSIAIELESFKITDGMLRYIQGQYHWTSAKIDQIFKDGDKTKKVSYTIDPSDTDSRSLVDEEYKDHGNMCHLAFEMPFHYEQRHRDTPSLINVKLYREGGHRIVINEDEFGNNVDLNIFQIYLMNELIRIKNESDGM